MSELRVLILLDSGVVGGPEKYVVGYARRLKKRFPVFIGTFGSNALPGGLGEYVGKAGGLEHVAIQAKHSYDPAQILRLRRFVAEAGICVINSHGYRADIVGWLASRWTRTRLVATYHGWTGADCKVRLFERLDRWVLKRMDHIICVSGANKKRLMNLGIADRKITVVENAIDPGEFFGCSKYENTGLLRREMGFTNENKIVVSIGRLSKEKGQALGLKAYAEAVKQVPEARLVFVGSGPDEPKLQRLADELNVGWGIRFVRHRKNVVDYVRLADIVLLSSVTEGLPTVVLEAFVCGKLVIATAVGGTPEIVREGETGVLVAAGDELALSRAIAKYLHDDRTRQRLGANAREYVMRNHCFDGHARKIEEVLLGL